MANKLIKVSSNVCAMCVYRMRNTTSFTGWCCNYLDITGHSRLFENGVKTHSAEYCDKFQRGAQIKTKGEIPHVRIPVELGYNPYQE